VLLEPSPVFVSPPAALGYLFGRARLDQVTRSYASLCRPGLGLIHTAVTALDPGRREVMTRDGVVTYDHLLIASGVRLAYEEVPGLAGQPALNLGFFETGQALVDLERRIAAFTGGDVVISTPTGAYKCPPAPYEYALLWADHLKTRGLRGRVTLLDPRPLPTPPALAPALLKAMDARADRLVYEPFTRLLSVDPGARTVETDAGRLGFDLLSVVPPNGAARFITAAALGDPFIEVDAGTFRYPGDPRISAVGDVADTPYARTASAAMSCGRIAGHHIARALGVQTPEPEIPRSECYPVVSATAALLLKAEWRPERDREGRPELKARWTVDTDAGAAHLETRRRWQEATLRELLGP
jgi:NADPH-dependent 2,4-dienoyl-CoA reductase/sulfur reductase-like enzyme